MLSVRLLIALATVTSGPYLAVNATGYQMVDLGTPGASSSYAVSVNSSGQIACYAPSGANMHAYMYDGTWHDLGTLGGSYSYAEGINDSGHIVGWADSSSGWSCAFLYDGTMHDLGTLGGLGSGASAINNSGLVVGHSRTSAGELHAFLYDGTMHDLGTLGGNESIAYDVNDAGLVVGCAKTSAGESHAFLYDGTMHDLGTLGGNGSCAYGVNNHGLVVGHAETAAGKRHAFLYDGTMHDLGTLGGAESYAYGVNNSGLVVGSAATTGFYHAFLWDGQIRDLGTLGGHSSSASSINDESIVVGHAFKSIGGDPHAFLLSAAGAGISSIGAAKNFPMYSPIHIENAVVVATGLETDSAFVEAPNRAAGIKLTSSQTLSVGQAITFTGITGRVDGEYLVKNITFFAITNGSPLAPLAVTTKIIGNDLTETLNYVGLNTTGLLVRFSGKVTAVIPGEQVIYVDDGFNYQDGLGPWIGMRVKIPAGVTLPAKNSRVIIDGISRVGKHTLTGWGEVNGYMWPAGTVLYVPSVWPRDSADIQIL